MNTFEQLGIQKSILEGLDKLGFKVPFPIQEAAIPVLLSGRDVVGQAHTGTGKTAAYSISMLQRITPKKRNSGANNCTNKGACSSDYRGGKHVWKIHRNEGSFSLWGTRNVNLNT